VLLLPCRVQKHYCRGFLWLCGVEVSWEGLEGVDYSRPVVGMFSHASNLDPMIVASGPLAFKWIAKDSLFRIPLFGWTLAGWGHFAINRRSLQQAKLSLQAAARQIHRYGRCLAVSPEGTRSKTGRLQEFKKGPFHTAIAVGLPVVPIVIRGNFQLWPPNQLFPVSGRVVVSLLPAIERREGEGHAQLSSRVRRAMLQATAQQPQHARPYSNSVLYVLWLPVTLALLAWSCSLLLRAIRLYTA
jgi:1-acyl-sn-glycerol-3-phosphate acyltransferase